MHSVIAPWTIGTCAFEPERLAAARVEPVLVLRRTMLAVDLAFVGDGGCGVIVGVLADVPRITERDRDPLVWPAACDVTDAQAAGLAERIVPLLEPLVLSGSHIDEQVFRLGPCAWFDAARAAGCYGAAPLTEALRRLAPYRWARRLARGRTVRIDAPDAAGGWAVLRDCADVYVDDAARDEAQERWYGRAPAPPAGCDIAIAGAGVHAAEATLIRLDVDAGVSVAVVEPLAFDVDFAFDEREGPVARRFAVERSVPRAPGVAHSHAALGGSSGRIALAGRSDLLELPAADTDEALALAAALRSEGFEAVLHAGAFDPAGYDVVHLFGVRDGRAVRALAEAVRRARIPLAVHAFDDDAASGGWWGAAVTRWCFEYGFDEADVTRYLGLLARRAVALGDVRADVPYAPPEVGASEADAVLREAAVVYAASQAEAGAIAKRTGRRAGILVVPPLCAPAPPESIGALVDGPFALVHAPIAPAANQLLAARAAAQARVPLVLAGPIVDASYLELVRAFGGPDLAVVPEPPPGVATALRAAAAAVVDPGWLGAGHSRTAAAALAGTPLAISERRLAEFPGAFVRRFDPADVHGLARALGEVWDEGLRGAHRVEAATLAALDSGAALRAIVSGYATAVPA